MASARTLVVLCVLSLSACALKNTPPHEEVVRQAMPNLTPPPQWTAASGASGAVADSWLASFHEPPLDALVMEAITFNPDLRIAAARVDTGRAPCCGSAVPRSSARATGSRPQC